MRCQASPNAKAGSVYKHSQKSKHTLRWATCLEPSILRLGQRLDWAASTKRNIEDHILLPWLSTLAQESKSHPQQVESSRGGVGFAPIAISTFVRNAKYLLSNISSNFAEEGIQHKNFLNYHHVWCVARQKVGKFSSSRIFLFGMSNQMVYIQVLAYDLHICPNLRRD